MTTVEEGVRSRAYHFFTLKHIKTMEDHNTTENLQGIRKSTNNGGNQRHIVLANQPLRVNR